MSKKLIGKFIDIANENTYYVRVGYDSDSPIYITDDGGSGDRDTEQVFFSGNEPVVIENDTSDTFEHVYIRQATINLISNFDLRNYVVARNYYDIPVEIRRDNTNDIAVDVTRTSFNSTPIFTGYVIPLEYNQEYSNRWNEFSVNCVDKLGILEYKKFAPLLSSQDYNTPKSFIDLCLNLCHFTNVQYNMTLEGHDYTQETKINPYIFVGDSEDDWMDCKQVLQEIGKVYGCYFYQNGDTCFVNNVIDFSSTPSSETMIQQTDYRGADTNISVDQAYNKVKATVDISEIDETFIDPFSDDYMTNTTEKGERVMSEIVYKYDDKFEGLTRFRRLIDRAATMTDVSHNTNWSDVQEPYDENNSVYDTYCQVMRNDMFDFGENNYLNDGHGTDTTGAYKTLNWLYMHPGKGAFLSFGKTDNLLDAKNKKMAKIEDMKNMLLIQVNSQRNPGTYTELGSLGDFYHVFNDLLYNQIDANNPICTFTMSKSSSLIPNDVNTTNYLVINGKFKYNPIAPRTGYLGNWQYGIASGHYLNDLNAKNNYLKKLNNISTLRTQWAQIWPDYGTPSYGDLSKSQYAYYNTLREPGDEYKKAGKYYQNFAWKTSSDTRYIWPYNTYADLTYDIAMPPLGVDYKAFKFEYSSYDRSGEQQPVDNVPRLPVLACQLKIGDKYLVEDFDFADRYAWKLPYGLYNDVYSWRTLNECPVKNGVRQTWFTLSINPAIGDSILGKEFDFADTVDISMNIKASGMAIPIKASDRLNGAVEFKILGPYNSVWRTVDSWKTYWSMQGLTTDLAANEYSLLAYVENIQLSDLSFKLYSSNGKRGSGNSNNDLVYTSVTNDQYIEEQNIDMKFCTTLTNSDIQELAIDYKPNNSAILDTNGNNWYGMSSYKGFTDVKLEEARVSEQYNIWSRPRKLISTTIRLISPEQAIDMTNYKFEYLKYSDNTYQIYRIISKSTDLKRKIMTCTMKEISDEQI